MKNLMKSYSKFLLAILLIGIIACQPKEEPKITNQEIEEVSNEYISAVQSVNLEQVLSFWMENLHIYRHSSEDIVGKKAFKEILEPAYKTLKIHEINVISREIDISENLAVEVVNFSRKLRRDGKDPEDVLGRYIAVWKKTDDGWKISIMVTLKVGSSEIQE